MDHRYGTRTDMGPEVTAAAGFVSSLLRTRGFLNEQQLHIFSDCLQQALSEHYTHHWFPEKPQKGSGYRCIRINHEMDPIISSVACRIGLSGHQLFQLLPRELTLWVDPYEVSYRIGEDGSICVLYEVEPPAAPVAPTTTPLLRRGQQRPARLRLHADLQEPLSHGPHQPAQELPDDGFELSVLETRALCVPWGSQWVRR
ncbi:hypothetical protein AAFF_G00170640 [Aldrovandia affinis]|uniref:Anti-proliferative protein domain-containing protein n=1 Tax=Aldrovandia affinis TaxID=143900 RepID=A0AAD7RLH4_9TELE|nr:hypothetical protein AAFF_G00170640 [Aldrovandia affinis]